MKVAFVTAHLSSASAGVMTGVAPLIAELRRSAVVAEVYGIEDRAAPGEAKSWGHGVVACPEWGPRWLGYSPLLVPNLRRAAPDLIDAQGLWMYPSLASLRAAKRLGCPRVISPHGMLDPWAVRRSVWKKRLALLMFERAHLRGAACIRALNRSELAAVRAFGLDNPIAVVPYGVVIPDELPARSARVERALLFLSRIDPKKGVHELLRGWKLAGADHSGWKLRIVGWGERAFVAATDRLVRELDLECSVELPGPAFGAAKDRALREADAFILPSYSEGLPVAVLEAWAYALPVLMTGACNLPEGFEHGAALELGTEPPSIAESIRAVVAMSDHERQAMGRAGRRLVAERFTWPEVARQMIQVYEWILGGGPPPACVVTD